MHQRLGECGGTRRKMLWGKTRLCIWRMQLLTPGQEQKTTAGLRHVPGYVGLGPCWHPPLWLKPPRAFP